MPAKVTPLILPGGPKTRGVFKVVKFSMFDQDDLEEYAKFRNLANDPVSGITIEMMREYSRKTTEREGHGEDVVVSITEEVILVVHYWQRLLKADKGASNAKLESSSKDWSLEYPVP